MFDSCKANVKTKADPIDSNLFVILVPDELAVQLAWKSFEYDICPNASQYK